MTVKKERQKMAKFLRKNTNISFGDSFKFAKKIVNCDMSQKDVLSQFLPVVSRNCGGYCDVCNCYHGSVTFLGKEGPITLDENYFSEF